MKFRKYFKIKYDNNLTQYSKLHSGSVGLKSTSRFNLTQQQLSAAVKVIKRVIKKKNFLIINCLPFWSITKKPRDIRMGRGKGGPVSKIFPVRPGKIIFEAQVDGINAGLVIKAFKYCSLRLPSRTLIIKKYDKRTDSIKGS